MGNEGSQLSGVSTPDSSVMSDYMSTYTQGSRRHMSASSSRQLSPVEPPEPDLSHLTEEERSHILSVLHKARQLHDEEEETARKLEDDYTNYAATVVRRASLADVEHKGKTMCPICHKTELVEGTDGIRQGQNVCKDCQRFICVNCGDFDASLSTNIREWVCAMCLKRRKLVCNTGLWYHGYHTGKQLPQVKRLLDSAELHARAAESKRPPLERTSSLTKYENLKEYEYKQESTSGRGLQRQGSLPETFRDTQDIEPRSLAAIREASRSSESYGGSFEDLERRSSYARPTQPKRQDSWKPPRGFVIPGITADDGSDLLNTPSPRPNSLTLDSGRDDAMERGKHGHYGIDSTRQMEERRLQADGYEGEKSGKVAPAKPPRTNLNRPGIPPPLQADAIRSSLQRNAIPAPLMMDRQNSLSAESLSPRSLSPCISPSISPPMGNYRESPPRSPVLMRRISPPLSPREDVFPQAYTDLSPQRQVNVADDVYADMPSSPRIMIHEEVDPTIHRPSPISPVEAKEKETTSSHGMRLFSTDSFDSSRCIDIATFAATIASDTDNLTNLSISPTHVRRGMTHHDRGSSHDEDEYGKDYMEISPDSSRDSPSPTSPNFYDDGEDIEPEEPSEKDIDTQGTTRQKARPPSNDWSPVTDLSPILDVSPSVELQAQQEMFSHQELVAKELNEKVTKSLQRHVAKNSGLRDDSHIDEGDNEEIFPASSLRRCQNFDDMRKIGGIGNRIGQFESQTSRDSVDSVDSWEDYDLSNLQLRTHDRSPIIAQSSTDQNANFTQASLISAADTVKSVIAQTVKASMFKNDSIDESMSSNEHNISTERRRSGEDDASDSRRYKDRPHGSTGENCKHNDRKVIADDRSKQYPSAFLAVGDARRGQGQGRKDNRDNDRKQASIKSTSSMTHRDHDWKARPQPLVIEPTSTQDKNTSPHYKVLDSPVTPKEQRRAESLDYGDGKPDSPLYTDDEEAYWYPSPVSSPESDYSPPIPRSPSAPRHDVPLNDSDERPSSFPSKLRTSDVYEDFQKEEKMESRENEASKKIRRKLPALPLEAKPVPPPKPKHLQSPAKKAGHLNNGKTQDVKTREQTRRRPSKDREEDVRARTTTGTGVKHTGYRAQEEKALVTSRVKDFEKRMSGEHTLESGKLPEDKRADTQFKRRDNSSERRRELDTQSSSEDINVYGLKVPVKVKTLKQQLKEELKMVVDTRRRHREEMEEIRSLERQLDEIRSLEDKQRKMLQEKLEALRRDTEKRSRSIRELLDRDSTDGASTDSGGEEKHSVLREPQRQQKLMPPATQTIRLSPQASPRRSRHKKQVADVTAPQFSPIKEDNDIEADFQARLEMEKQIEKLRSMNIESERLLESKSPRLPRKHYGELYQHAPTSHPNLAETDRKTSLQTNVDYSRLSSSYSELPSQCPSAMKTFYSEDDVEKRYREEKKQYLQIEIEKRKRQIGENAMLQGELKKIAEATQVPSSQLEYIRSRYYEQVSPREVRDKTNKSNIPIGIIKPLDDKDGGFLPYEEAELRDMFLGRKPASLQSECENYSSSEYLAHKTSRDTRPGDVPTRQQLTKLAHSHPSIFSTSKDSGMSSSHTLSDWQPADRDWQPQDRQPTHRPTPEIIPHQYEGLSDYSTPPTDNSPHSESPPPMPLLDDVTRRSRKILHGIGSRPLSEEYDQSFSALEAMHRIDSTDSLGDPNEKIMEHLTEGGITILKQVERKRHPPPREERKYPFPTKRILLTRDPKDRSIRGNSVGLKIVGGKFIPGTNEVGAYVAKIYPGGVADQLHGELQEGDQVLEWNGVPLTGKTYEDVQKIVHYQNGEIDIVVKVGSNLLSASKTQTLTTLSESHSSQSSYDNLEFVSASDIDDYDTYSQQSSRRPDQSDQVRGIDPSMLAAHLQDISPRDVRGRSPGRRPQSGASPGPSPSSSQHDVYMTPGTSTPSPLSDKAPSERSCKSGSSKTMQTKKSKYLGELQIQLHYDDIDHCLTLHIIQAKGLLPKDVLTGYSDPFVKAYLLPGRTAENKRRTQYARQTLNPEWHQTFVFQNVSNQDLSNKTIELTVWDYDRFKPNDFLGEVIVKLKDASLLDNTPHWFPLREHRDRDSSSSSRPSAPVPTSPDSTSSGSGRGDKRRQKPAQYGAEKKTHRSSSQPPQTRTSRQHMPLPSRRRRSSLDEYDDSTQMWSHQYTLHHAMMST